MTKGKSLKNFFCCDCVSGKWKRGKKQENVLKCSIEIERKRFFEFFSVFWVDSFVKECHWNHWDGKMESLNCWIRPLSEMWKYFIRWNFFSLKFLTKRGKFSKIFFEILLSIPCRWNWEFIRFYRKLQQYLQLFSN